MYDDSAEPVHCSSKERWERSVGVEGTPDSLPTMATDDICETSPDLPGPFRTQSTRSCSLSSQESVKQWLKSVDQDAEYPGDCTVTVDDTLTDRGGDDGEMEYPFREKISRGDSTEDDLTLGSEAKLLDPPVSTTSAGAPPTPTVLGGTQCYWLSNHARMNRQARLMQMGESFESFATETSTQTSLSSNSIEGLLQARTCDPEELLLSLGFGGGGDYSTTLRVPDRFLQHQSRCGGVDLSQYMAREMAQDTAYHGWAGVYDRPVSTMYHRRMSTGSIAVHHQYRTYDPALCRRMTQSTINSHQPSSDHRTEKAVDVSHDPLLLRRSVTVSTTDMAKEKTRQSSSTGAASVAGEVEDVKVQILQETKDVHPKQSGTSIPTSTKAQRWAKRATLVKQRSAESFCLDKDGKLSTEDSGAKRPDNRGKMRKRSLSMPHIQCNLEPVKEESPHSSLENTLQSKELSEMLQHALEKEFSQELEEKIGRICYSPTDPEDNTCTSSSRNSEGVFSPVTQNEDMQQLQFTTGRPGGSAVEEKPEAMERIAFVVSPDATSKQGPSPKRKACRLSKVPNVDADSPPEDLLFPRSRLTSTPDDKLVSVSLPVPQTHAAFPQESFEMEEIGSTDVTPEEGAWPRGSTHLFSNHGNLQHQNSAQSDSSGFADDSHIGSDPSCLMDSAKIEGLGSSAESLASTRTVIHVNNSQGALVDGLQETMTSYCPMQLDLELHHDSKYKLPESHYVENSVQERVTVNEEQSSTIAARTSCHSSSVPNVAFSDTNVLHSGKTHVKTDRPCVHCGKFFKDHRNKDCAFQDADLSACLCEDVLPQFSVGAENDHCDAIVSQGASLNVVSAVNMLGVDNTASGEETQGTQTIHEGHKRCSDDQESTPDPTFTSQSGHQPEDNSSSVFDVGSVSSQPEKLAQTTNCKLEFPAELSQHYTIVDNILQQLKNSLEKVTSHSDDSDVKITLQQTTEHLDWPVDVGKNIAPEKLDHIRGVPYIKSAGESIFPVKLSSGISVELTRNHSQGSRHEVCKKYVLVEETKHYTKIKDPLGGKDDVKEVAVRRKKEVTAPPTANRGGLWENLPENERRESGEKALQNVQRFVEEARGKFLVKKKAECDGSQENFPNQPALPLPTADSLHVKVQQTGETSDQGLKTCDRKQEQDDSSVDLQASPVDSKPQTDVRRQRAPSVAEELSLDIMEPVNRYTAEGIARDLQKTSSEVSISNSPGTTDDHPLQDYWTLAALVMSSRHEKLSEIQLGSPGHYDLHYTSPKEHLLREVDLARCCMTQYRGQLVQLELTFAQCYAAFYNHMTGQERQEVELLVVLRAEVLQEAEVLETMLANHLQAVIQEDPAVFVEEQSPSSLSKLKLLGQLIELLKEQGHMQQALAVLVQNSGERPLSTHPGNYTPAPPPLDPGKQWELLSADRERVHREVRDMREELCTQREDHQRDMDKNLHKLRMSIMADVRLEIAEQMKLLRLQLQAKEEEVRMLRLQMRQQTKTQKDEVEGGSQRTKKSIRVTQL
ncbi:PREDICTED: uncharacterized protein LOC109462853 [Branchiostoma belcheri]|uniref:Uncharacterized protein LOC109462853 n=1 Tax=Branchiostoma belcheri TaxID=7741 RepID=A0A6P4YDQ0_BRABE|nr:PREDICTED: uncharacterized protein LOC109462853 [Branchiostoma belcheri]